jgi:hypothetical protein
VFDENLGGAHSVFRMKTKFTTVICGERLKIACKQARLTDLSFQEVFHPPFDEIGTITALPPRVDTIRLERQKRIITSSDLLGRLLCGIATVESEAAGAGSAAGVSCL